MALRLPAVLDMYMSPDCRLEIIFIYISTYKHIVLESLLEIGEFH